MILTYLRGVTSTRLCAAVVSALFAMSAVGCSGGKHGDTDRSTTTVQSAVTLAPGAETPLTELVQNVQGSNAALASLMAGLGGEGSNDAADEVTLLSAQLANAAADAIEQSDERELDFSASKRIETAGAAAHVSAAAMVDAAGNALDADDGANRVATFGAAVAGAHAAGVSAADAAAALAASGQICGSKTGLKETLISAGAAMTSAKNAADSAATMATAFGNGTEGGLAQDAFDMAAAAVEGGPTATDLVAALAAASDALDQDPTALFAALQNVKTKVDTHKEKVRKYADKVEKFAKNGAPGGNAEANAKAAKAGAGDADRKCAAARKDILKKHASKKAAAHTAGAALAVAKKRHLKERTPATKKKVARVAWELNKAAAKGANGAAKTGEDADAMEEDLLDKKTRKRKIEKSATGLHIVSAGAAHVASKMMDEEVEDDDVDAVVDLGAMLVSMDAAMDSLADAGGEVADGEGIESELGEMLEMVTATATATNTLNDQVDILLEMVKGPIDDQDLKLKLQDLHTAVKDKGAGWDLAKKSGDAAKRHGVKGEDPTGAGRDVKEAVNTHKPKSKTKAEKSEGFALKKEPKGRSVSVSKAAAGHASDAPEKCAGLRKHAMKKIVGAMSAAHTTKATMAAAKKKSAKDHTADSKKRAAEAADEANKASTHLGIEAHRLHEKARDAQPDAAKAERMEGTSAAAQTFAAGLGDAASKVMDDLFDDGSESIAEMMASVASAGVASNSLIDEMADEIADEATASPEIGEMLQELAASAISSDTATDMVADMAETLQQQSEDGQYIQALEDFKQAARSKESRQESMKRTADAAWKLSDSGKDASGSAGEMKGGAQADKASRKNLADKADGAASVIKPGGLSASVSKTASAGASDAPQICASTKEEAMKQLASSMAGAHAAARGLAAAHKKAQKEKSSKSFSKLGAMKMHAHKASSHLAISADKAMEAISEIGLPVDMKEQMEAVIDAAHTAAGAMAAAAAETVIDEAAACDDAPISDLAAMAAALRVASNALAQSSADVANGFGPAKGIGHVLQMTTMTMVSADTASDDVADTAEDIASKTQDGEKQQLLSTFKLKAKDKGAARDAIKKGADAAQKHSDATKDPTGAAAGWSLAAKADKPKTKETAGAAHGAAQKIKPNGSGASFSKIAEGNADEAPSKCANVTKDGLKRLASADAAAKTTWTNMSAAMKKKQKSKTADSHAKLAAIKKHAHKASSKLAIESTKAMEMSWEIGGGGSPAATKKRKIQGAATASHTFAGAMAEAAGKSKTDDDETCGEIPVAEYAAVMASIGSSSNGLVDAAGEVLGDGVASKAAGSMMRMVATGATAGGKAVSEVGKIAADAGKLEPESEKTAAYGKVKEAADDKATWEVMQKKAADVSKKFSSATDDTSGAAVDLKATAAADKGKAREHGDKAAEAAGVLDADCNAGAIATNAAAGAADAPASCAGGSKETVKKLASALAAAHTVGANLAAAYKEAAETKSSDAHFNLAAAKEDAHKAGMHLSNTAAKAVDEASAWNLRPQMELEIHGAASSAEVSAMSMMHAASKTKADDKDRCTDKKSASDMGAMWAAHRVASTKMALVSSQVMSANETWSVDAGQMMQMTTDAEVSAATTAEHVSKISEKEAARNPDAAKKGKLTNLKNAADDKADARFAIKKSADASRKFSDQTKSTAGAATDMKSAAQFDKPKSKGAADTAADTAGTMTPGENGEAISKAASAGATDAPGSCGGSIANALKQFSATLATAQVAAAHLSAAHKKAASAKTADSMSKLHWAVMEAHKAGAHLANKAAKTMETTQSLGLSPAAIGQLETTLALAHTMAIGLTNAGAASKTEDDGICADTPVSDMGGLLASSRMVSNSMAQTLGLTMASAPASTSGGQVMQWMVVSSAAENTGAEEAAETWDIVSAKTADPTKKQALDGLKAATKDDVFAKDKTRKASEAAKAHSGSGASTGSTTTDLGASATVDKVKAKLVADAAITNSKAHAAGGNGEAISKLSKAGAADLPPAAAPSALQDAVKKLASAKAAAEMAAAVLAKVSGKVAKSRTAANNAEKEAIVQDAQKAAAQLALIAHRTLEIAADLGLTAAQMAHVENIVAAALTFAANLSHASAKMATDDDSICKESSAAPELGGVATAGRGASNALALGVNQILGAGATGSQAAGHMLSLFGAGAVGANLTADFAGDTASIVADGIADANLQALLRAFRTTSNDNASAKAMGNKIADAAETFANGTGGSPSTKVADVNAAAVADKVKAKILADSASATANGAAPGSNTWALTKLVSVTVTGDPASGPAPTAAEVSEKRSASAMASGQIIGAMMASAAAKFEAASSSAAAETMMGILANAHAASGVMGNASSKTFDTAGSVGLGTTAVSQLEAAMAAHHTAAAGLGHAATQQTTGDAAACGEKAKIADLGAMLASARGATNMAAQSAAQAITATSTQSGARLATLMGVAAAGSNTLAEKIESAVDAASVNTSDSGKLAAYASLKQAAGDKTTATALVNKAADLAQIFSSGVGSKATAISGWATAATTDKPKAKQTADASTSTANVVSSGGNAESLSKISSAGVTGDPASGQAASTFEQALKKLASAMAAAHTAASNLAAAVARSAANSHAETIAKNTAAIKAASNAAVTLNNVAIAIGNDSGSYGLSTARLAQLKLTLTAVQAAAANLAKAAAQASLAISGSCTSKGALANVEASVSGAQMSASSLATTLSQALSGLAASGSRSRLTQMLGATLAAANISTKNLGDAALTASFDTTDPQLLAALTALLQATAGNGTALTMTSKAANTATTIAGGGNSAGALTELNSAISGASTFIATLGSVAGAAAAGTPTGRIAQLSEPSLWTASNGSLSLSPISANGFNSISVAAGGYTPVVSAPMSSADIRASAGPNLNKISYALLVPTNAPNPFWVGQTQMFINAPSANVFNVHLGNVELTGQPLQTFIRPSFTVPASAMPALTGDRTDVTLTITLNVNGGTQGWLLNDLKFGQ